MALTQAQMLKALHEADPSTLKKRYTPAQLQAAYSKKVASAPAARTAPPAGPRVPVGGDDIQEAGGKKKKPPSSGPIVTPPPLPTPPAPTPPPAPVEAGIPDNYKQKFDETVGAGEEYGNHLIDTLGLKGEFLGRVSERASDSYYADLQNLRNRTSVAGDPTALDQEALGVARNALQGLNSQENQALRSAAVADVNRQFGTQQQALMRFQGGTQPTAQRTAQLAQLGGSRVDAQRSLARDLLIQNIQEKKDARNAFGSLTQAVGSRADSRTQNLSSLLQSGNQFADTLTQQGQQFNSGNQGAEIAARTGALVGGVGTASALYGGYQAQDFQAKALEDALAAKDKEIQATKDINKQTLEAQERIMKQLAGKI